LLKMMVAGERCGDVVLAHHDKRRAIRERPIFVGPLRKQSDTSIKESKGGGTMVQAGSLRSASSKRRKRGRMYGADSASPISVSTHVVVTTALVVFARGQQPWREPHRLYAEGQGNNTCQQREDSLLGRSVQVVVVLLGKVRWLAFHAANDMLQSFGK
jgi:hypothetical protein